jgi:membrane dipeptidase
VAQPSLIIDGHLDLAFGLIHSRRDLTLTAAEVRAQEHADVSKEYGTCTVTLPELRRGRVGIVFATVMVRIDPAGSFGGTGLRTQPQCYAMGRGHAACYEVLERTGEARLIRTAADLAEVARDWREHADARRIGIVMAMESADPIVDPQQVSHWHEIGLRCVSLSHYGTNSYAHGTGTEGGLFPRARDLLAALKAARILVDVTHLTDKGFWEVLEAYDGPLIASHHNCRALVPGQRQLTDDMIKALVQRDAVIGTSFDLWMLDPKYARGSGAAGRRLGLEAVADQVDHVCQLAGSSRHAAMGSDLDGGYGVEQSPLGLETIADMPKVADILAARGYAAQALEDVFSGNWMRALGRVLS